MSMVINSSAFINGSQVVDADSFNLTLYNIEKGLSEKTRAIIPAHLFVQTCPMEKIMNFAQKHGLFVVEERHVSRIGTLVADAYRILGKNCNIGQNVVILSAVKLGNNVKVQNNVSVYTGVTCDDDVFLGLSCVFTNVVNPRSGINRREAFARTHVGKGATNK